jgi:hypothetical protein
MQCHKDSVQTLAAHHLHQEDTVGSTRWRSEQPQRCRPEPVRKRYLYAGDARAEDARSKATGLVAQERRDWLHEAVFEQQESKECKIAFLS